MKPVRRAVRIVRATTNPVPARLHSLPDDVLAADASGAASSAGHDAWRKVAEIVDDEVVVEAVDDHVVALLVSAVNLGILTLGPQVADRLLDRFDRTVRPRMDEEIARRREAAANTPGEAEFTSNVRDHVWLYQTTRIAAALDPAERSHLEQTLPAVIGVGLRAYTERGRHAAKGPVHLASLALVSLVAGGAVHDALTTHALDPVNLSAVLGALAGVAALQARKVHGVRSSGIARAATKDARDVQASGEPAEGSLARLRGDIEARRTAVRQADFRAHSWL